MSCPCGRPAAYADCCGRFIEGGAEPERAVQLMRSRYTAFVRGERRWLDATVPPALRPHDLDGRAWLGLEILRVVAGRAEDATGEVEFRARYTLEGFAGCIHERARFERREGRWLYVGGAHKAPVVGRNAPCPCGSGRKSKRCCGG